MALIEPGKKAPSFTLKDQDGTVHRLADYAGRPVVLYFFGSDGKVVKRWDHVKVNGHAEAVLAAVNALP